MEPASYVDFSRLIARGGPSIALLYPRDTELPTSPLEAEAITQLERQRETGRARETERRVEKSPLTWYDGAEDGIRTRDPHLGKVRVFVRLGPASPLKCGSVHPVSTSVHPVRPCSRALYYRPRATVRLRGYNVIRSQLTLQRPSAAKSQAPEGDSTSSSRLRKSAVDRCKLLGCQRDDVLRIAVPDGMRGLRERLVIDELDGRCLE